MLAHQQHDTENPQWFILLIRTQDVQKIRRELLHRVSKLQNTRKRMALYTQYQIYWKMWWDQPHNQKLEPFFTMDRKRNLSTSPFAKWATDNQRHPCKLTIPLQNELQTIQCTINDQKTRTCTFIGLNIESNKTISMSSGNQARQTWEIIFTKHQPPHHHREMRPIYLHIEATPKEASERVC